MKTRSRGFTIIELMIAIAIIGVLAAIAVPAYQDYIKRAKVSEGIVLATQAKIAVTEYYQANNKFPISNAEAGISPANKITGNNVTSLSVDDGGKITVTYAAGAVGDSTALTINLQPTPTETGYTTWQITSEGSSGVPQKWCPSSAKCNGTGS